MSEIQYTPYHELVVFQCIICGCKRAEPKLINISGSEMCQRCFDAPFSIRHQFEAHLKDENQPVRWLNNETIPIDSVREQFSEEFVAAYHARMEEYFIKPSDRIYCECEGFLGAKAGNIAALECPRCSARCCTACGAHIDNEAEHRCAEPEPLEKRFEGLKRGCDYQICPKCDLVMSLIEACNHITCTRCDEHFCYICGEHAVPGTSHWVAGKPCPYYNQPGAEEAMVEEEQEVEQENIHAVQEILNNKALRMLEIGWPGLAHDLDLIHLERDTTWWERDRQRDREALVAVAEDAWDTPRDEQTLWLYDVIDLAFALIIVMEIHTVNQNQQAEEWKQEFKVFIDLVDETAGKLGEEAWQRYDLLEIILKRHRELWAMVYEPEAVLVG